MDKDEEVFLDAEEEVTPCRSGRKRRSTAGSVTPTVVKRPKTKDKMPTKHSPKNAPQTQAQPVAGRQPDPKVGVGVGMDHDAFWSKMGGMLGGLEARMKMESDQVKEQLGVAVSTLGDLGIRVERAEKRLDGLAEEVNSVVDKRLACLPPTDVAADPAIAGPSYASALLMGPPTTMTGGKDLSKMNVGINKKEEAYWHCRRALRLQPVGKEDIIREVKQYMVEHLKLTDDFVESLGHMKATRVPAGPSAKIKGEVSVSFQSTEARDAVKGSARNLAGKGQDFRVRLEVPNHLKSSLSAL